MRTLLPLLTLSMALGACNNKDKDVEDTGDTTPIDTVDTMDTGDIIDSHTGDSSTDTSVDTGESDSDTDLVLPGPDQLGANDLVITEIMINPTQCTDPRGEYVEVVYQGTGPADLAGLVLANGVGDTVTLAGPFVVNPNDRVALYAAPRFTQPCYAFPTGSQGYDASLSFPQGGDILSLRDSTGRELDGIDYAALGAIPEGASLEYTGALDSTANDSADAWCAGIDLIAGANADLGTPGLANTCTPIADTDTDDGDRNLIITEILDFQAPDTLRYVEIWNPTGGPVTLDGWSLALYADGSSLPTTSPLPPTDVIPADGCYLIGPNNGVAAQDFAAAFGQQPDASLDAVAGNGDDAYALLYQGQRIDLYGEIGASAPVAWDYTDSVAWREGTVTEPRTAWLSDQWTVGGLERRSPCDRLPTALSTDTAIDDTDDLGNFETGVREDTFETDIIDTSVEPLTIDDLVAGDLVVTEIMANPDECTGSNGEYIELRVNPFLGAPVDLDGLQIQNSGLTVSFSGTRQVSPGQYIAAWYRPTSGTQCYGWAPGFGLDYTTLQLNDTTDFVRIKFGNTVFDEVNYAGTSFTMPAGAALALDPRRVDNGQNNDATNWCESTDQFFNSRTFQFSTDNGSPGTANAQCDFLVDTDDTDLPVLTAQDLDPGYLLITEVLGDLTGTCADEDGEYVEVYNNTPARIQLDGLKLVISGADTTLSTAVELLPGELAILARTPASTGCIGFGSAPVIRYPAAFDIDDAGTTIALQVGASVIDQVNFSVFSPAFTQGAAWTLDPDHTDPAENDLQVNWCTGSVAIGGGGNSGSPGTLSDCP